jgi:hypothetical protein
MVFKFKKQHDAIASIDILSWKKFGVKGLILDLDNTIVSEDDKYLSPGAIEWIQEAKSQELKLFILSNGKRRYRAKTWSERLNIPLINPAHKPFPYSFWKALLKMKLKPKQVLVIGDSLHTDILGSYLVGCHSIHVASLPHPPLWWEKIFGKWVQFPYTFIDELCKVDDFIDQ